MPAKSRFPAVPLSEAREIARVIAEAGAGQPMRRLDVFGVLGKSPDSGPSRTLVTASSGYDLTTGSYRAPQLALTTLGKKVAIERDPAAEIDAVLGVEIFRQFFETYSDKPLPSDVAAKSFLADNGVPADRVETCLQIVKVNGRDVGLIAPVSGMDRVLPRDHALEKRHGASAERALPAHREVAAPATAAEGVGQEQTAHLPSLNVNLEIHLPPDASPDKYDAIFRSIRKHLMGNHPVDDE